MKFIKESQGRIEDSIKDIWDYMVSKWLVQGLALSLVVFYCGLAVYFVVASS